MCQCMQNGFSFPIYGTQLGVKDVFVAQNIAGRTSIAGAANLLVFHTLHQKPAAAFETRSIYNDQPSTTYITVTASAVL